MTSRRTIRRRYGIPPTNKLEGILPKILYEEINSLILCANCHRQLHYADVDIENIKKGKIKINGLEKTISK